MGTEGSRPLPPLGDRREPALLITEILGAATRVDWQAVAD